MPSVFSKNSILSGCVDYYCLACETQLRSDEDAISHIVKPIHKKNLDSTSYLDKYKEDRVKKVKKGYFCEYCNLFMRTAAKVGPHIAEPKHVENKSVPPLRREENGVLAFDEVLIGEAAWHGLIDDTCAVCDSEFEDAQIHQSDTWHALNLALAEVEYSGDNVYRKVDDSTFQCLTCNLVCALNTMDAHFQDGEHKKLYEQCRQPANNTLSHKQETPKTAKDEESKSPEKENKKNMKEEKEKKTDAEDKAKETATDDTTKKTENQSVTVKTKKAEKEIVKEVPLKKSDNKETESSVKKPKDALLKTDKDICKVLGAVDYITRSASGRPWCILCDWEMDDCAVGLHISSRHHQTILKMHKERAEKNQTNEPETNGDDTNENKSRISDSANEFQKNDVNLDLVLGTAYCRKCAKSIDFNHDLIKNHIDGHKKKRETKESKPDKEIIPFSSEQKSSAVNTTAHKRNDIKPKHEKERESRASSVASNREELELEAFAKQHDLTYAKDKHDAFCRVCVSKVPASIKNMREHVNGTSHKNKVAKITVKSTVKPTTIPSNLFVDEVITVENIISKDIVINEKYVLSILSFLMITKNGGKYRCQVCEMNLALSQIDAHKNTHEHEKVMNEAPVVTSEASEFIREIRPDLYHCGYCNQLESPWATMRAHTRSGAHSSARAAAAWRLLQLRPLLARHRERQRLQFALFTRMAMEQMFGDY